MSFDIKNIKNHFHDGTHGNDCSEEILRMCMPLMIKNRMMFQLVEDFNEIFELYSLMYKSLTPKIFEETMSCLMTVGDDIKIYDGTSICYVLDGVLTERQIKKKQKKLSELVPNYKFNSV